MGFGQAISTGFAKYFNFHDRACRSEFWYWTLFTMIVAIVAALIDMKLDTQLVAGAWNLVTLIPGLAISIRRLHDLDRSGWWVLLSFIPLVGAIILLVWFATKGTAGPNRYGPDPIAATTPLPNQEFGAPA
jgi:uncharacterized membrane protein YhaH (DUF805 family)